MEEYYDNDDWKECEYDDIVDCTHYLMGICSLGYNENCPEKVKEEFEKYYTPSMEQ